jgi:hypothetical protein
MPALLTSRSTAPTSPHQRATSSRFDERSPADLLRHRADLLGGAARDDDVHAGASELPRDVRADPASAARHDGRSAQFS